MDLWRITWLAVGGWMALQQATSDFCDTTQRSVSEFDEIYQPF